MSAEDNKRSVRAVVRGGVEQAELARQRIRIADPPIGGARDGIQPGQWGEPPDMPPDCPVRVLGLVGGDIYLIDTAGQVRCIGTSQFSQAVVEQLFGQRIAYVYWAWPRFGKAKKGEPPKVDNFRTEKVRQCFYAEADRRGIWDAADDVRGRGCWRGDRGELIVHCGDYMFVNGRMQYPGEWQGKVYPSGSAILHPWMEPVDHAPALTMFRLLDCFSWARGAIDAYLLLGWIGSAMLSGALRVRPSALVIGDKGRGKTTFQDLVKEVFGNYLLKTEDTTPAGIYQRVNHDSRPVAVDELENDPSNNRALDLTRLARLAYSGAVMLRGGSNHVGTEFTARSSFLMSMINPPPATPAELSRMGVFSLLRPDKNRVGEPPVVRESDQIGRKILKRLIDHWHEFDEVFKFYAEALHRGGHEQRGQDTYGTMLTCAHLMLGPEGIEEVAPKFRQPQFWADELNVVSLPEYDDTNENWYGALSHLLGKRIDHWRGNASLSVGALLEEYQRGDIQFVALNKRLAQVSLKLLDKRQVKGAQGAVLAIPGRSDNLAQIYQGKVWAAGPSGTGGWTTALRDAPGGVVITGVNNRVSINMSQERCTLIDLKIYSDYFKKGLLAAEPDVVPVADAKDDF
jgi:hypothetical protein